MIKNQAFFKLVVENNMLAEGDIKPLSLKYNGDDFAILMHLVKGAAAKKDFLGKLWGDSLGVAYVNLLKTIFQNHVVQQLPEKYARLYKLIPLYHFGQAITVAAADPANRTIINEAERIIGKPVSPVFSFPDDIEDAMDIQYQTKDSLGELIGKIASNALFKSTSKISPEQLRELAGEQSIIQFTQGLCLLALKERASDIHIEPAEDVVRIRFRIDGVLQERLKLDLALLPPLITRIKVMAKLDITERRRPQDGRITLLLTNRSFDLRFSSVPTIYGEKVVLRILGEYGLKDVPSLSELSFSRSSLNKIIRLIEHPNGVVFVTGPTGSGKTTTLYAALKHINKPGVNIMTIEDPVEIRLAGVNQVQVNHEIDFDFTAALRAFLRQDPNVILVGEIRDAETAKIAAQAALTGHLVLTTMHTNNALQAVTRLIEIGIEPFLVAPSIIGTMAQRLVRRLCDNCKERYQLSKEEMDSLFEHDGTKQIHVWRAKGCDECQNTGYSGRIAIHEVFIITAEIRQLIARNSSSLDIQEVARKSGFESMRYDGIKKVIRGITSLAEIDRVTIAEEDL